MSDPDWPFSMETVVRFRDCDPMGHVNNAVYLTYFEIARVEFWSRHVSRTDVPFILAEATVTFRAPARTGQTLKIEMAVESIGTKSWTFLYRITDAGTRTEIALGRSVQVAYDYAASRTVPLAAELKAKLTEFQVQA